MARTQRSRHCRPPANKPNRRSRLRHRPRRKAKFARIRTVHRGQLDCGAPARPVRSPAPAAPRPEPTVPRRSNHKVLRPVPWPRPAVVRTSWCRRRWPGRRGDPDDAARWPSLPRPSHGVRRWRQRRLCCERSRGIARSPCGLRVRRLWRRSRFACPTADLWRGLWWSGVSWPEDSVCGWEGITRSPGGVRQCLRSAVAGYFGLMYRCPFTPSLPTNALDMMGMFMQQILILAGPAPPPKQFFFTLFFLSLLFFHVI